MSVQELTTLKQNDKQYFGELYHHIKGLPLNKNGVKVSMIRHLFTYHLTYWQQPRMLHTLYSVDYAPYLDMPTDTIIDTVANTLFVKHTSVNSKFIIKNIVPKVKEAIEKWEM